MRTCSTRSRTWLVARDGGVGPRGFELTNAKKIGNSVKFASPLNIKEAYIRYGNHPNR